jgi:amino acid transporter
VAGRASAEIEERDLVKAISWWDGFMIALANPGFLLAALGGSIGALGTLGAAIVWTASVLLGSLQNNIYAEMATMFPDKSGGIAVFAHEAWRKYCALVGPVATFGYWFAWSTVLSISGLVAGTLLNVEFFSSVTYHWSGGHFHIDFAVTLAIVFLLLVYFANARGIRGTVLFSYVTGILLLIPCLALMFLPYITGDWHSSNLHSNIASGGGAALVLTWLYFMGGRRTASRRARRSRLSTGTRPATHRGRCARRRRSRCSSTRCCRSASAAPCPRARWPTTRPRSPSTRPRST